MWVNQPVFRRRYSRRQAPENINLSSQDTDRLYCMAWQELQYKETWVLGDINNYSQHEAKPSIL